MSQTLYWQPHVTTKRALPSALRDVLLNGSFGFDGTSSARRVVVRSELGYFRALVDVGVDGALKAFNVLDEHDVIELWVE